MEENQVAESTVAPTNTPDQTHEKLFTRDQLAKIVSSESAKAAQNATRLAEEKYQRDMEALNATRVHQEQRNAQVPRDVDDDALYQRFHERLSREMQEQKNRQEMSGIADSYLQKVDQAKSAYSDFDEVSKDYDPTAFPQISYLLSGIDGGGDVLYDLMKNPLKLAGLDSLAQKNQRQAHSVLLQMAQSINANKQAQADAQNQTTAEPLDRLQPSRVSGSNGQMGISDLRNQPWLRG
jgi:hypothetical protein